MMSGSSKKRILLTRRHFSLSCFFIHVQEIFYFYKKQEFINIKRIKRDERSLKITKQKKTLYKRTPRFRVTCPRNLNVKINKWKQKLELRMRLKRLMNMGMEIFWYWYWWMRMFLTAIDLEDEWYNATEIIVLHLNFDVISLNIMVSSLTL